MLSFAVAPRFYETNWFRGVAVLTFALAGPLFHRFRIRWLTRQKAELGRVVAERAAEVETANAQLAHWHARTDSPES